MLSETRAELDEFHQASKELEAELESELQRTEKAQHELRGKVIRAENERDEWKVCINMALQHCLWSDVVSSPSLCPYKRHITRQRLLCNENWINSDKNTKLLRSTCANWRWEMTT